VIKIIRKTGKKGRFAFYVPMYPEISGSSRTPMLDACRALKALGVDTETKCGLFREGRSEPDLTCTVGAGAALSVAERDKGIPRFTKYEAFEAREA
jgi:hypothetical protein